MKICPNCGRENTNNSKYCNSCGAAMDEKKNSTAGAGAGDKKVYIIGALAVVLVATGILQHTQNSGSNNAGSSTAQTQPAQTQPEQTQTEQSQPVQEQTDQVAPETAEETNEAEQSPAYEFPAGTLSYNGHHFFIYDDNCSNWQEAMERCESRGGYLAVINNDEENEALFSYMVDSGYDAAFFGLTDKEKEGSWRYTKGDDSSYTDWGSNSEGTEEPNNADGGENYAALDSHMVDGHWNDAELGRQIYTPDGDEYEYIAAYICEWDY